jgi:hypothetical protein
MLQHPRGTALTPRTDLDHSDDMSGAAISSRDFTKNVPSLGIGTAGRRQRQPAFRRPPPSLERPAGCDVQQTHPSSQG